MKLLLTYMWKSSRMIQASAPFSKFVWSPWSPYAYAYQLIDKEKLAETLLDWEKEAKVDAEREGAMRYEYVLLNAVEMSDDQAALIEDKLHLM